MKKQYYRYTCREKKTSQCATVRHTEDKNTHRALILERESVRALIDFFLQQARTNAEMLNNNGFYTVHQNREKTMLAPSSFYIFFPSSSGPRPKLTSLMHEPIARHCGGIQHQPTTCSIKYGGMAFKAMLNAPDMGRERAGRAAFVRKGEESEKHVREELLGGIL